MFLFESELDAEPWPHAREQGMVDQRVFEGHDHMPEDQHAEHPGGGDVHAVEDVVHPRQIRSPGAQRQAEELHAVLAEVGRDVARVMED